MSRLRWVTADPTEEWRRHRTRQENHSATHRPDLWQLGSRLADAHPVFADTSVALAVAIVSAAWFVDRVVPADGLGLAGGAHRAACLEASLPGGRLRIIALVALVQWASGSKWWATWLFSLLSTPSPATGPGLSHGAARPWSRSAPSWPLSAGAWPAAGCGPLVFLSGLVAAAFLLGTNLRSRRSRLAAVTERAERLEREREQQALIAATAERTRIAREMHDVIAHSLAVMISLADGANAKLRSDPERAGTAIQNLSRIGRQALGDTRRLLGVLRDDGAPEELAPQPGLAQIDGLLAQVRTTGLAASLAINGEPRPLPPGAELTVYRIVQEATTNALKHAVGATSVAVALDYSHNLLAVSVQDNGRAPGRGTGHRPPKGSGHGLSGMSERAAIYRGTVVAGPCLGGWSVEARIPITPVAGSRAHMVVAGGQRWAGKRQRTRREDSEPAYRPLAGHPFS